MPKLTCECGTGAGLMVEADREAQSAAVKYAFEQGIMCVDTPSYYGNSTSERNLGKVLRALRASPSICTTIASKTEDLGDERWAVLSSLGDSIERLHRASLGVVWL